jgi:hypothetical protein
MYVKLDMRSWALSLLLLAASLCGQPNAKADDDRDYWRYRHDDHWRHRDYDEDRDDWRRRHYGDWRERREYWRHRHHHPHEIIQAGPVLIER